MNNIKVEIEGMDELQKALKLFPTRARRHILAAGNEAIKRVILPTQGLQKYPPSTAANEPPEPYYIRGRGTQTKHGNLGNSERLGTQWYKEAEGTNSWNVVVGNRASYAKWVHGTETQASAMERIGWRKLYDVATEKMTSIQKVYQAWVDKLLKEVGLK